MPLARQARLKIVQWIKVNLGWVRIALKRKADARLYFFCGSRALFMRPVSTEFSKNNFKIGSHDTIHVFKNYFVTVFSVFSNKWYQNRSLNTIFSFLK